MNKHHLHKTLFIYFIFTLCIDINLGQSANASKSEQLPELYGRIEELEQIPGAKFPNILKFEKAKTAKKVLLKAEIQTNHLKAKVELIKQKSPPQQSNIKEPIQDSNNLRGTVVKTFPKWLLGNWGGQINLTQLKLDHSFWKTNPEEANATSQAHNVGQKGTVNFCFYQTENDQIELKPARIVFFAPLLTLYPDVSFKYSPLTQQWAMRRDCEECRSRPPIMISDIEKLVISDMKMPFFMGLENSFKQTLDGTQMVTLSGAKLSTKPWIRTIHEMSPNIIEQELISQNTVTDQKSKRSMKAYTEIVIRFTKLSDDKLRVQIGHVSYFGNHQYMQKIMLDGTVDKGKDMPEPNDPWLLLSKKLGIKKMYSGSPLLHFNWRQTL